MEKLLVLLLISSGFKGVFAGMQNTCENLETLILTGKAVGLDLTDLDFSKSFNGNNCKPDQNTWDANSNTEIVKLINAKAKTMKIDLSGAVLRGANLTGLDFSTHGVDFSGTADMSGVIAKGVNFGTGSSFNGRPLFGSDFTGATCINCDFSNTGLGGINLTNANLSKSTIVPSSVSVTTRNDLRTATLKNTNLSSAQMSGVNLSGVNFNDSKNNFSGVNFSKANFKNTGFGAGSFTGANFTSAIFDNTTLSVNAGAKLTFEGSTFTGSSWANAKIGTNVLFNGAVGLGKSMFLFFNAMSKNNRIAMLKWCNRYSSSSLATNFACQQYCKLGNEAFKQQYGSSAKTALVTCIDLGKTNKFMPGRCPINTKSYKQYIGSMVEVPSGSACFKSGAHECAKYWTPCKISTPKAGNTVIANYWPTANVRSRNMGVLSISACSGAVPANINLTPLFFTAQVYDVSICNGPRGIGLVFGHQDSDFSRVPDPHSGYGPFTDIGHDYDDSKKSPYSGAYFITTGPTSSKIQARLTAAKKINHEDDKKAAVVKKMAKKIDKGLSNVERGISNAFSF